MGVKSLLRVLPPYPRTPIPPYQKNMGPHERSPYFYTGFSFPNTGGPVVSNRTHRPATLYAFHAPSDSAARRAVFICNMYLYLVSYGKERREKQCVVRLA